MKCQHCGATEHLQRNSVNKQGRVGYMCRKCSAQRKKAWYHKQGKEKQYQYNRRYLDRIKQEKISE